MRTQGYLPTLRPGSTPDSHGAFRLDTSKDCFEKWQRARVLAQITNQGMDFHRSIKYSHPRRGPNGCLKTTQLRAALWGSA
jgi:hypothetical protein